MAELTVGEVSIPFSKLKSFDIETAAGLTPNQWLALDFAAKWHRGQKEFEIKTSGSTGEPKKIVLQRNLMEYSARQTLQSLNIEKGNVILASLSIRSVGGLMMLVRAFISGNHVTVTEPSANPMENLPKDHNFSFISLVPLQLNTILSGTDIPSIQKLNRFKKVLIGGAAMTDDLVRKLSDLDPEFYHSYGMTETYSHIALRKINGIGAQPRFVPLPDVKVRLDEEERLVINSPVTGGMELVTNDRAILFADGSFEIMGRADNVINSGGVKIQLEKVENALSKMKQLKGRSFFAWWLPDAELGQKLIAVIQGEILDSLEEYEMKVDLRGFLERYEVPKQYLYLPAFAYTESGKTDRIRTIELAS